MKDPRNPAVTLVGGGLAGALLAVFLGQRGYRVRVYEKRPDIRDAEIVRGRSINLAISTRGLHALSRVGLEKRVLEMCVPMPGRIMHDPEGNLTYQPYGTHEGQVINSVSRGDLNKLLLTEAGQLERVELHFEERCVDLDVEAGAALFEDVRTGERHRVEGDLVIGADGAFSAVRQRLQRRDRFSYSQEYLEHGYKELHIPPAEGGGFRLEKNALHIWPRQSYMMIALPNNDGSFTCTLFWPHTGPHGFESLTTPEQVRQYFETHFADAVVHMPTYVEDYLAVPASSLVTIRCHPWSFGDSLTLVGDACHAVVPFYGQGMNAAFEDCAVFDDCIEELAPDWTRVLAEYERRRKVNTDALADLAVLNFLEMRDQVASPYFLFKKQLGKVFHRVFPRWFLPLYSMVTFSRIPYAEARERSRRQVHILRVGLTTVSLLLLLLVMRLIWR